MKTILTAIVLCFALTALAHEHEGKSKTAHDKEHQHVKADKKDHDHDEDHHKPHDHKAHHPDHKEAKKKKK